MSNKNLGILLLICPFIFLIILLALYGILDYLTHGINSPTLSMVKIIFGFLGIIFVIGIPIAIIFGFKNIKKYKEIEAKNISQKMQYDGLTPDQINYINRLSWGAFFCTFIWALGNKLYLWAFGCFVPFWNVYVWLNLFVDGRRMAWEKNKWISFKQFTRRQIIMAVVIAIFIILRILNEITKS
jgi:hypothetical protein